MKRCELSTISSKHSEGVLGSASFEKNLRFKQLSTTQIACLKSRGLELLVFWGLQRWSSKIDRGVHSTILFVWSSDFFLCVWTVHVGVCYSNSTFWLDFLEGSQIFEIHHDSIFFCHLWRWLLPRINCTHWARGWVRGLPGVGLFDDFVQQKSSWTLKTANSL